MPFFDNGLMISGDYGQLVYQAAVLNGNAGSQNDNGKMDLSISAKLHGVSGNLGAVWQKGQQPDGLREFREIFGEVNLSQATFKSAIIDRVDLKTTGFVAAFIFKRAGPVDLVMQYDAVINRGTDRYWDFGVNHLLNKECVIQSHIIVSNMNGPEYFLRFKILLGN